MPKRKQNVWDLKEEQLIRYLHHVSSHFYRDKKGRGMERNGGCKLFIYYYETILMLSS